ncbi:O-antigen ligase family protein [candidate division WOR-3 bacterium]|nr:O-antigen ligase family protein [candidate division WOR-3 bacterium]
MQGESCERISFERISFNLLLGALFFTPISAYVSIPLMVFSLVFFLISGKRLSFNLLDYLQFVLLGALLLSSIFAVYKTHSFYAGCAFLTYILAYFLAKGLFDTEKRIKRVVKTLSILVLVVSAIGILQYFTHFSLVIKDIPIVAPIGSDGRIISLCYNTLILASFLGFALPILIIFFMEGKFRIFFGLSAILGLTAFFLTQSRGPTIGFIFALFVVFILIRKRAIAVLMVVVLIGVVILIEPLRTRFSETFYCSNDISRIIAYHAGIRMWLDHSILTGVGIHNFSLLFEEYALPGYSYRTHYIHCMYLNFLVDAGVIGFLSLMAVFGTAVECARRLYKNLNKDTPTKWIVAGLMGSFMGIIIHNLVDNTIYVMGLGILVWMGMGIISGGTSTTTQQKLDTDLKNPTPHLKI